MEENLIKRFNLLGPESHIKNLTDVLKKLPMDILLNTNYNLNSQIRVSYVEFMKNKAITFSNIRDSWEIKPLNEEVKFISYTNQRGGTLTFKWEDYSLYFEMK